MTRQLTDVDSAKMVARNARTRTPVSTARISSNSVPTGDVPGVKKAPSKWGLPINVKLVLTAALVA